MIYWFLTITYIQAGIEPNVGTYNTLLYWYGNTSRLKEALDLFEVMKEKGIAPDDMTFVSLLRACSHGHDSNRALQIFKSIPSYGIKYNDYHYVCLIDALGRDNRLLEAEQVIKQNPHPTRIMYMTLLGSCRLHSHVALGEKIARQLIADNPTDAVPYVLLSNIYASKGQFDKADKIRKEMEDVGAKRIPGESWVIVDNEKHTFVVSDPILFRDPKVDIF